MVLHKIQKATNPGQSGDTQTTREPMNEFKKSLIGKDFEDLAELAESATDKAEFQVIVDTLEAQIQEAATGEVRKTYSIDNALTKAETGEWPPELEMQDHYDETVEHERLGRPKTDQEAFEATEKLQRTHDRNALAMLEKLFVSGDLGGGGPAYVQCLECRYVFDHVEHGLYIVDRKLQF